MLMLGMGNVLEEAARDQKGKIDQLASAENSLPDCRQTPRAVQRRGGL
jgi:hypothetical protein